MDQAVARINNYEVWVMEKNRAFAFGLKPEKNSGWVKQSDFIFDSKIQAEREGIGAARRLRPPTMTLGGNMNLGKLVRQKMKALKADMSGEYIDNAGKHFEMSSSGEAYTVSYGGGAKSMVLDREDAHRLAGSCRKLG